MRRGLVAGLLVVTLLMGGGCLGTLRHDPATQALALTAGTPLDLPLRESRPYWLLRSQPGWISAFEAGFGGEPGDGGIAVVRTVLFRDVSAARRAFGRLTPEYLFLLLGDHMQRRPEPWPYPADLPGDEVTTATYDTLVSPGEKEPIHITGQLVAVRSGRVVVLIDSVGVQPEQLISTLDTLSRAARGMGDRAGS